MSWNVLPPQTRVVKGYLVSRGPDGAKQAAGDHFS